MKEHFVTDNSPLRFFLSLSYKREETLGTIFVQTRGKITDNRASSEK